METMETGSDMGHTRFLGVFYAQDGWLMAELIAKAIQPLLDLFPGKHDCSSGGENGRLRVDQNRIGVRGQIRIGEYRWHSQSYLSLIGRLRRGYKSEEVEK